MDSQGIQFGRYRLLKLLARGGMGEVYLAQYAGIAGFEKMCVIKKIRADMACQAMFTERFLNEGRTLVALTQSNIVQIFDMGEVDGVYYLAMEYVKGTDLREILRRMGSVRMPVICAVAVVREMLKGLGYAHRASDSTGHLLGIVHRDVSPSNVMISTEGEVKLIDFGIAKIRTVESCSGLVQGKFAYMSPEQARGEQLDARTDLFSCGVVLYEMLCGVRPFEGDSDLQSLERVKTQKQLPLSVYRPDVGPVLESVLDRVLSKDRACRYESAEAFYDALEPVMAGQRFDQRDIAGFFAPFMSEEGTGTVEDAIEGAIDEMLHAQASAKGRMATQTIDVVPADLDRARSGDLEAALEDTQPASSRLGAAGIAPVSALAETLESLGRGQETAEYVADSGAVAEQRVPPEVRETDVSPGTAQSPERAENTGADVSPGTAQSPERAENAGADAVPGGMQTAGASSAAAEAEAVRRSSDPGVKRRMSSEFRYGLICGLIGMGVCVGIVLWVWYADSARREASVRDAGDRDALLAQAEPEPRWKRNLRSLVPHYHRDGVPLHFVTEPEAATLYIVEGGYRAFEGKSVQLLTDRDVEIALQAPGYETCMFRLKSWGSSAHAFRDVGWEDCLGVSSRLSLAEQRLDVDVRLKPLRSKVSEPEKAGPETAEVPESPESAEAGLAAASDVPEGVAETEGNAPDVSRVPSDGEAVAKSSGKGQSREKGMAGRDENRIAKPARKIVSSSVSASVAANLVADGQKFALPAEVSLPVGTPFEIQPQVSGRKVAVPYRGKFGEGVIRGEFCEATVRIEESYVPGDPAPYQVADIYLDGRRIASSASLVRVVAPCQSYDIEARTGGGGASLRGRLSVRFDASEAQTISLHLSAE